MLKRRLDREVREAMKEADWDHDSHSLTIRPDEDFADEEQQYHSDNMLSTSVHRGRAEGSPPPSPRSRGKSVRSVQESLRIAPALHRQISTGRVGGHDRQHMPRLDTARFRKARRKNLARSQRDAEEQQFGQAAPFTVQNGEAGIPVVSTSGSDSYEKGTVSENPEESTSSESEPLLRESKGEQPDGVQTHQKPSKHKTKAIKGEWQFKMYTDVLHAQSSFARDELVAVARAEMQEGRREAAASRRQERLKARNARSMRSHGDTDGTGDDGEDDGAFSDDMHTAGQSGTEIEVASEEEEDLAIFEEIEMAAATVADLSTKHVFCYAYGCVVFWGLEPEEEKFFLDVIHPFEEDSLSEEAQERDDMNFLYGSKTRLYNDQICLATSSPLEKLSISFALAQSTKLSALELRVEETFESTRLHPQELADTGHISLSQTEVSKLIGHLFIVNSSVNLESDMLSCPEFFWENDEWEPLFRHAGKYLEIDHRVTVLNKRMDVLDGMFKMLKDQLELIWNILIKDILGLFNHGTD